VHIDDSTSHDLARVVTQAHTAIQYTLNAKMTNSNFLIPTSVRLANLPYVYYESMQYAAAQ